MTLGIIPAAGEGSRWGQFQKELLPIGKEQWLIDCAVSALVTGGADKICIVTSPNKIHTHAQHFMKEKYRDINIFYIIQKDPSDLWGAIKATFPYTNGYNLFAMPDTLIPNFVFPYERKYDFSLGLFTTDMPEKFGVFDGGRVFNKDPNITGVRKAWGLLSWSANVVEYWKLCKPSNYTEAINKALEKFTYGTFTLPYYWDFASWEDYCSWVKNANK